MKWQMKRKHILELRTQGFANQSVKDLAQKFNATQKFGQIQKPNRTKDASNGP
jgi:hypothetical protein